MGVEDLNFSTRDDREVFAALPEEVKDRMIGSAKVEATKINDIKDYEKRNNVDQDTIAKSYLSHFDIYKSLQEEMRVAMEKFYLIEKSNGSDHPGTKEAKLDWDIAYAKMKSEGDIMISMLDHLTPETMEKYKRDFELHGAANTQS
jgi:predicted secreted Zn-dependent protease